MADRKPEDSRIDDIKAEVPSQTPAKPPPPGSEAGNRPVSQAGPASLDPDARRKEDDARAKLESAPAPAGGTPSQDKYDNPTAKIWSVYMSEANPYDKALIESWTRDMDGILIFAGLFSAVVTAFIIESYASLMPDPNATTVALLQQISQQLAGDAVQNATLTPESFSPTSSALRVNAYWFLSLCLALTCALAATLVQQWARHYTQGIQRRPAPHLQARMRVYLFDGMEKFKMSAVVDGIPTLLHASVLLFFVGLADFLYQINIQIACVAISIIAACGGIYTVITILPVFHRQSPFQTPLSEPCWAVCRFLGLLQYCDYWGYRERLPRHMAEGRETLAGVGNAGNTKMAVAGLRWALNNLTEDAELQPFVEGIPAFCEEDQDAEVMRTILMDLDVDLLPRVMGLLRTCGNSSSLTAASKQVRSITCLNAIATLCELHSTHPWTFVHYYEGILGVLIRVFIIPMTKESDQQVAGAAKSVIAAVVKLIHSLTPEDPLHPIDIGSLDIDLPDHWELRLQQNHSSRLPEWIEEWDALAYDTLFPPRDSTMPSEAHEDDGPDPIESARPIHSGNGIPSDQQKSQTNSTLALGILDAVADGRAVEEVAPTTQPTSPSQVGRNQTILAAGPVGERRDGSDDEHRTASPAATGPSHIVPGDGIHLQQQEVETNATAAPVTAPSMEEGRANPDQTGPARATGLPQRHDSGKHVRFQQQEPETSIQRTPATASKMEERSSDEGGTESAWAIGGSEAVAIDPGDNINPQQSGPTTRSSIKSAPVLPVQERGIEGKGEG